MVRKETLHLGQSVLYGEKREVAVVDALTQTGLAVTVGEGRYVLCRYEDIFAE